MTDACYSVSVPAKSRGQFDILRGAGLAFALIVIFVAPAALSILAYVND